MRITAIRERAVPVRSAMRNAAFDFSEMTTSIVAVITDIVQDNRPVVGYAFNSTGRYACGAAMRERFIPRVLAAPPDELLDAEGLIDPAKVAARMGLREKPGGDAERSVPIGTIETAIWDALAKSLGRPLWHVLAERYGVGPVRTAIPCYVGGGWYQPRDDLAALRDEVRRHLDDGYTCLKIKTGGVPLEEDCRRIDAVLAMLGDASRLGSTLMPRCRSSAPKRMPRGSRPTGCVGSKSPAGRKPSASSRISRGATTRRWRQARTCIASPMSKTSCASAASAAAKTFCKSIPRRLMASLRMQQWLLASRRWAGAASASFRMAAT
jgi:hypothetical protein